VAPAQGGGGAAAAIAPPGGCAELAVTAWLAGDQATLSSLMAPGFSGRIATGRRTATRVYTVSAVPGPSATWPVTVAADIVETTAAPSARPSATPSGRATRRPGGTQYFQVPLAKVAAGTGCAGWVAVSLPLQVAQPQAGSGVEWAYDKELPAGGNPMSETLERFFNALLVGVGELDRYIAPGLAVRPVSPPPYDGVRLEQLMTTRNNELNVTQVPPDGTRMTVLAIIMARLADGSEWPLAYPLRMAVRGGRWEVVAVDAAPLLAPREQPSEPAPAGSTTPSNASASPSPRSS